MPSTSLAPSRSPFWILPAAFAAACLILPAASQVPAGTAVVGTSISNGGAGVPGLFLLPLTGGPVLPVPVTGLPTSLTAPSGRLNYGIGTMDVRRADGAIVVGAVTEGSPAVPQPLDVYFIHLNGNAVAACTQVTLGQVHATSGAFVAAMPDGRVLVAAADGNGFMTNGPLAGSMFGIIDFAGPTITPIPNPPIAPGAGSIAGGLAVDPTGHYAYFTLTLNAPSNARVATLNRIGISPGGYSYCTLYQWPGEFQGGVSVDDDGTIRVSSSNGNTLTNYVHTVHPNGCGVPTVSTVQTANPLGPIGASSAALDRASQRLLLPSGWAPGFLGAQFGTVSSVDPATGAATVIATLPQATFGALTRQGIVVFGAIDSYGPCTDGLAHYWFENFSNPGGQPVVGNLNFSLTLRSGGPLPVLTALALSLGRGAATVAGVQVNVDAATAQSVFYVPAGAVTHPLPIPANPAFVGLEITAQSFHLEGNGALAASAGLSVTIQ